MKDARFFAHDQARFELLYKVVSFQRILLPQAPLAVSHLITVLLHTFAPKRMRRRMLNGGGQRTAQSLSRVQISSLP